MCESLYRNDVRRSTIHSVMNNYDIRKTLLRQCYALMQLVNDSVQHPRKIVFVI